MRRCLVTENFHDQRAKRALAISYRGGILCRRGRIWTDWNFTQSYARRCRWCTGSYLSISSAYGIYFWARFEVHA